ncbi:MAG TPA: C10 family peptidase [Candidatus Thermoplasmatota archaeon]|nr:C10 family peptidase [Candidatus Thermoplasmatota archaeon]
MMRTTFVIFSSIFLTSISGVSALGFFQEAPSITNYYNANLTEALHVAQAKLSELQKSDFFIIHSQAKYLTDGTPLYYVFNLAPQGYLVVSGSHDLPPVIAYSFTNDFPAVASTNPLSDLLTSDLTQRLSNLPHLPEPLIQERRAAWDSYLQGQQSRRSDQFEQWPPEGSTPTDGWLLTQWNQNSPYNNLCPLDLANGGGRSVAGCPAIAMAQIMNYHNTTNDIAFDDSDDYYHDFAGNQYWIDNDHATYNFPSFPQLNSYLASLQNNYLSHVPPTNTEKAALTFACGVAAHQVYSESVSGTYGVNQAYQAYQRFNCSTVVLLSGNDTNLYGRLAHNMMDALPDHLAVVDPNWQYGHNLDIDGYNTDEYYHLNFGWSGSYDGWYLIPDEIPYGLTVIEGVIVDILKTNLGVPDLSSNGALAWADITPGDTATGTFTVSNIGDAGSDLAWRVTEWPAWGTWTFEPRIGHELTPEDGSITIAVSTVAPNQQNQEYTGQIKVVNMDDANDYHYIPVSLKTGSGVKSDLSCSGILSWTEVHPGAMLNGSFTVQNIGSATSNLSWEVVGWPAWGSWTFTPSKGDHLTPENGPLTVNVTVVAPDKKHTKFSGEIRVTNSENSSDNGTIPVALSTPYKPDYFFFDLLRSILLRFPRVFPILHHLFTF